MAFKCKSSYVLLWMALNLSCWKQCCIIMFIWITCNYMWKWNKIFSSHNIHVLLRITSIKEKYTFVLCSCCVELEREFFKDISVQRHVKKRERERERERMRVLNIGEVFGKLVATKAKFLIIAFFFALRGASQVQV